jgi:hypothetical protein
MSKHTRPIGYAILLPQLEIELEPGGQILRRELRLERCHVTLSMP